MLFDTSTGVNKQFVVAVPDQALGFTPDEHAVLTMNFIAEQQNAKSYLQYTYRRSLPFSTINGVEDGQAKKVLRYDATGLTPDVVEVYLNGVRLDQGTGATNFQICDGTLTSPVPPNTVLFNNSITGASNQVDIVVTKANPVTSVSFNLTRITADEARVGLGAWEGIDAVTSAAVGRWSLFSVDFTTVSSSLTIDVKLRYDPNNLPVLRNHVNGSLYNVVKSSVLLSRTRLFTAVDRNRAAWVPVQDLTGDTEYLVMKVVDGVKSLLVTQNSAQDLFPVLDVVHLSTPALVTTGLTGDAESTQVDNQVIVGPDV